MIKNYINNENINPELICIYSLPRSGSTVLIAELDRLKGVACLPESYFPQILELLSSKELSNHEILASFFLASSPSGTLLTFEEAKECMVPGDWYRTLVNLGIASAVKADRDPSEIKIVVWKTTRIIGRWRLFNNIGGRFIILNRNKLNVFESQFRVDFGRNNRNPFRFAAFLESYEAALSRIPKDRVFYVEYERIPDLLPDIIAWLRVDGEYRGEGESLLARTHAKKEWHQGLLDGFESRDHLKRKNVKTYQRLMLKISRFLVRPLRPILGVLRDHYDKGIMAQVSDEATRHHERYILEKPK